MRSNDFDIVRRTPRYRTRQPLEQGSRRSGRDRKVGDKYVLQDPSAARTRARLVLPADDGLVVILTDNDIEKGILTFTATNAKTNECVLQAQISTPGLAITEHHRPTIRPLLTISASAVPSLTSTPLYQSAQQKMKKMRPIT